MAETKEGKAVNWKKPKAAGLLVARQLWTALGPITMTIAVGITSGYSSVLLPQLRSKGAGLGTSNHSIMEENDYSWTESDILLYNREVESWIAASGALLVAPGCWLSGFFMDTFGRKTSLLIISSTILAGWLTIALAPNLIALTTGRLVCGLCVGLQGTLGVVYVAETSEPFLRSILMAILSLGLSVGILFCHVLGIWLHWRLVAHLSVVFPIICFSSSLFATESPSWFLKKNKPEFARKAWLYLRGETAEEEYESIRATNSMVDEASNGARRSWWRSPSFLKPFLILTVFFLTSHLSGVNLFSFYCVQLIQHVSGPDSSQDDAYWTMLVLDGIRVAASLMACWLIRNYERRFLTGISGVGSSASLLGLGVVLFFGVGEPWLPVTLLLAFICLATIGIVPLPCQLCGELFPVTFKGLGSGLCSSLGFICAFIVVKNGPTMFDNIGIPGTFMIYGTITLCGTVLLCFLLPETKDRTLQEIEDVFEGSSKNKMRPAKAVPI